MKKAGLVLFLVLTFFCASFVGAVNVSYGTIGIGATAIQVGPVAELYTTNGGAGSAYVKLDIPGGIALNTITSLSYTAKVTNPGSGGFAPEIVIT